MVHKPINYTRVLVSGEMLALSVTMFVIAVESPKVAIDRLERSVVGLQLFTFRGRYMVDLLISLFLFAMAPWGIPLGIATLALIFGIRFLGVKQPDAFNEIFRQAYDMDSQTSIPVGGGNNASHTNGGSSHNTGDAYTLESEYDTPVVERR